MTECVAGQSLLAGLEKLLRTAVMQAVRRQDAVYEKQNRTSSSKKAHYEVFEFMALLAGHIPSPYETITFYDGIYSSSYRGKERKEKREDAMEIEKIKGKAKASASWARLIHKIFEVDPLLCPNCGKAMKIIALITNHQEIKKILKHIGEETKKAPPLPAITRYELEDSYDWGDFPLGGTPPDGAYFCDEEWGL